MSNLPIEAWVILGGGGAVVLAVILIRFGKQIARALLILAGVVVVGIIALALLGSTLATRQQAEALEVATAANAAQSGFNSFLAGAVLVLGLGLLGVAGYFFIRWKVAERRALPRSRGRRFLPRYNRGYDVEPVVYIVEGDADDVTDITPFGEVVEWEQDDSWQF